MSEYSEKMPDMGVNEALAGKTVYDHGMNVVRDEQGRHVTSWNPNHEIYAGTTRSVRAQPIAEALEGKAWEKPSVVGLVDWNGGKPDYSKPIRSDEDFDWSDWAR